MPRYNLALIPLSQSEKIIECAQQFSNLADKYLLGKKSLPHVTLYHFNAEKNEIAALWKRVGELWQEKPIKLEFKKFSCTSFDGVTFWASLLPNHSEQLHQMHKTIAQILDKPIKETFDPHMSLFNSKNSDYQKEVAAVKDFYQPITDRFVLSLGYSDDVGQLLEVILKMPG